MAQFKKIIKYRCDQDIEIYKNCKHRLNFGFKRKKKLYRLENFPKALRNLYDLGVPNRFKSVVNQWRFWFNSYLKNYLKKKKNLCRAFYV